MTMAKNQRGFSLIEMMVSMVVLVIVVGAVLQLLSQSQSRSVASSTVEEATAMDRDALDLMVREIRLAGYPPPNSYPAGVIVPGTNEQYVAVGGGFRAGSDYAVQFEADLDNDGVVEVIDYELQVPTTGTWGGDCGSLPTNANLTTPTLMRSELPKNANGTAVTPVFQPFLENVLNCEQSTRIFSYCLAPNYTPLYSPDPCPDMANLRDSTLPFPQHTRIVLIRLQVVAALRDPQTGVFQNVRLWGLAERVNPDQ